MIKDYKKIDISGLICPLDIIRVTKMMKKVNLNEILKVVSSKPLISGNTLPTEYDLIAFCNYSNYTIIRREITHDKIVMYIKKTQKISEKINTSMSHNFKEIQ